MIIGEIEYAEILNIVGAIVAVIALILSLQSNIYSRRALRISEADHERTKENISLYLMGSAKMRLQQRSIASFVLSITNQSTLPETITRIELKIFYKDEHNEVRCFISQPEPNGHHPTERTSSTQLKCPLNLNPKASEQGWIVFVIPPEIETKHFVEKYRISAISSSNTEAIWDVFLLSEIASHD